MRKWTERAQASAKSNMWTRRGVACRRSDALEKSPTCVCGCVRGLGGPIFYPGEKKRRRRRRVCEICVCCVVCSRVPAGQSDAERARRVCIFCIGEWRHLTCPREESGSRETVGAYNAERAGEDWWAYYGCGSCVDSGGGDGAGGLDGAGIDWSGVFCQNPQHSAHTARRLTVSFDVRPSRAPHSHSTRTHNLPSTCAPHSLHCHCPTAP